MMDVAIVMVVPVIVSVAAQRGQEKGAEQESQGDFSHGSILRTGEKILRSPEKVSSNREGEIGVAYFTTTTHRPRTW